MENLNISLRPMIGSEKLYCFTQSQQLIMQSGNIGYLRADMGSTGYTFHSLWNDFRRDLNTDKFNNELHKVINSFRVDEKFEGFLSNRESLKKFCNNHPDSRLVPGEDNFGLRADTEDYVYMIRINPNRGEYNLYCYCYKRDYLDLHMQNAERGIRIIDSDYNEKFRVSDGEKIRIITKYGEIRDIQCRYIDDYHLATYSECGNNLYHICEFAEEFESSKCRDIFPLRSDLPEKCFSTLPSDGSIIVLTKGMSGYVPFISDFGSKEENQKYVYIMNQKNGISRAQEEAMKSGSMFGWATAAANPKNYDENGKPNVRIVRSSNIVSSNEFKIQRSLDSQIQEASNKVNTFVEKFNAHNFQR